MKHKDYSFWCIKERDFAGSVIYIIIFNDKNNKELRNLRLTAYRGDNNHVFGLHCDKSIKLYPEFDDTAKELILLLSHIRKFADNVYKKTRLYYDCHDNLLRAFFGKNYRSCNESFNYEHRIKEIEGEL